MNKKTEMINQPTKTNTNNIQYYTMAELSEISKNNGEIDLKKISPELMGIINLINKSGEKAALNAVEMPADDLTDEKIMTDEEKQVLDEKLKSLKIMQLESILKEKYGESYSALEEAVRNAFENLSFKDARQLLISRKNGEIENIMLFYDNIYKDMSKPKNVSVDTRAVSYPPKMISGGNFNKADKKEVTWQDFI